MLLAYKKIKANRQRNGIIKVLKEEKAAPRDLCIIKISFENEQSL